MDKIDTHSDLTALLARVEAAGGPDRELDAEIAVALSGDPDAWVVNPSPHSIFAPVPGWWRDGHDKSHSAPELTASLDADLALCERVLPGWTIRADIRAEVSDFGVEPAWDETVFPQKLAYWDAKAKTPALALLAALLKAKIAESQP